MGKSKRKSGDKKNVVGTTGKLKGEEENGCDSSSESEANLDRRSDDGDVVMTQADGKADATDDLSDATDDLSDAADTGESESSSSSSDSSIEKTESDAYDLTYYYEESSDEENGAEGERAHQRTAVVERVERAASRALEVIQKYGEAELPSLDPADNEGGWEIPEASPWRNSSAALEEITNVREEMVRAWMVPDEGGEENGNDEKNPGRNNGGEKIEDKNKWWKSVLAEAEGNDVEPGMANSIAENGKFGGHDDDDDATYFKEEDEELFREAYMEMATDAFAEELEALRMGRLAAAVEGASKKKTSEMDALIPKLDPTHHSFVVASIGGGDGEEDVSKAAALAVAEVDVDVLADMLHSGSHLLSAEERKMLLRARRRREKRLSSNEERPEESRLTPHERRRRELGFVITL